MKRHILKLAAKIVGAILAISLALWAIGYIFGWGGTAAEVISPDNVKKQHAHVIGLHEDMIAAADNACSVQEGGETTADGRSVTFVESPTLAYEATFRSIVADYNAAVDNLFEAGIVAPPGYPESVELKALDTDDWCTVASQVMEAAR